MQNSAAKVESDPGELGEDEETVAQKRVRTAKDFIRKLEARIGSDDENTDEDEGDRRLTTTHSTAPAILTDSLSLPCSLKCLAPSSPFATTLTRVYS